MLPRGKRPDLFAAPLLLVLIALAPATVVACSESARRGDGDASVPDSGRSPRGDGDASVPDSGREPIACEPISCPAPPIDCRWEGAILDGPCESRTCGTAVCDDPPIDPECPGGPDAGECPPCDGTPLGDCMRFACVVARASELHCAGAGVDVTFVCTGIESFPPDYLNLLTSYFNDCSPELAGFVATDVETMSGPVTITPCQILKCSTEFLSQRSPAPMVIRADCAPVPAPACDLPDPPMM